MPSRNPLENLAVASPCTVPWEGMAGGERVRHCGACRLNVYDLSAMTRGEAEALVAGREGRLCVRFFRRADGTVLTRDCPVGLRALRLRIARSFAAAAALLFSLVAAGCGRSPAPARGGPEPTMGKPSIPVAPTMGDVVEPPALQGEIAAPAPK